jgi:hypothetical protein
MLNKPHIAVCTHLPPSMPVATQQAVGTPSCTLEAQKSHELSLPTNLCARITRLTDLHAPAQPCCLCETLLLGETRSGVEELQSHLSRSRLVRLLVWNATCLTFGSTAEYPYGIVAPIVKQPCPGSGVGRKMEIERLRSSKT